MIRKLTILILSITQVFSGLGGGGYLCFDKDGTYCGVHAAADGCHCCSESVESADAPHDHKCCGYQHEDECCAIAGNLGAEEDESSDEQIPSNGPVARESLPCGCIHIPIIAPAAKFDRASDLRIVKSCSIRCSHHNAAANAQNPGQGLSASETLSVQTPQYRVLSQHRSIVMRC